MQRINIDTLPDEIILYWLKYHDPQTIITLCYVSTKMNRLASDKSIWLSLCENHPILRLLVCGITKQDDFNKMDIDFKKLYFYFFSKDPNKLKTLFLPDATFPVFFGSYTPLSGAIPRCLFFPILSGTGMERTYYLSEEIGKTSIANIQSIKGFAQVDLPLFDVDLSELRAGKIIYNAAIKQKAKIEHAPNNTLLTQ